MMQSELLLTLKNRRKELGLSQLELAQKSNLSLATLQNIESGKANPELKTILNLFEALGLQININIQESSVSRWINFGLPMLEKNNDTNFQPNREKLIQSYLILSEHEIKTADSRTQKAWVSFLCALRDHYNTIFKLNSKIANWLQKNEASLLSPKLRRISLQVLGSYL